ncbi:cell wall-associated NlpC family hydrolase [Nakamurella sp. UYEF19]|uniref:NlpC/P60 family protein n=1 Tax=Nakamurella sp. UYEF19 TaxID=1756392 RepID=UPI00339562D6
MAPAGRIRSVLTTAVCAVLSIALFVGVSAPAGAVPPPPPNPSDQQIQDSKDSATASAAEVGRLSGLVSATEGDITRLNDDMELKGELVKKAMIDQQLAESDAANAEAAAQTALEVAGNAGGAITVAKDKAAAFAAASFRQGSVLGSMTALMDASSASDLLARQEMLNEVSKSQLDVIATLQTTLSDKANLDSDAKVARAAAAAAQVAAERAAQTAQQAKRTADDAFVAGKAQLATLNTQLDQQENDYQLALSKVADLKDQRAQYDQWLAAKKAEEERLRLEAIARAKALAAAKAAAAKAAAEKAAALAAAEARAKAAERARLQAIAVAEAKAAAAKAAADKVAAEQAARLAKKRFDDEQAQLKAAAAARKAAAAQAAAAAANAAKNNVPKNPTVYYANCAAAVQAGVAPIAIGQPGYRKALDTNGNGIACEFLHGGGSSTTTATSHSTTSSSTGSGGWTAAKGEAAVAAAEQWVGTPYSWGGGNSSGPTLGICGPNGAENDCNVVGFDCSGLTSYGWAQEGISIPNYSVYQYTLGQHISQSDLLPGDLLFYANNTSDPSTIHHVTMYAGNGMMVEAPYSGAYVHVTSAEFGNGYIGATRIGT